MSWMYVSRFVSLQVVEFPHFVPPHHSFVATSRNLQAKQKKKTISGHENQTAWLGPVKNHHIWVWKAASILLPREFIAYYHIPQTNPQVEKKNIRLFVKCMIETTWKLYLACLHFAAVTQRRSFKRVQFVQFKAIHDNPQVCKITSALLSTCQLGDWAAQHCGQKSCLKVKTKSQTIGQLWSISQTRDTHVIES